MDSLEHVQRKPVGIHINTWFERNMFIIIPVSLILGFLFSGLLSSSVASIPWVFAYITFVMALGCGWEQMRSAFRMPVPMIVLLVTAHIITPLLAYGSGILIFGSGSPYVIGLVLFAIIPLGVSSTLWVNMSGGSLPLMLSLVVIDSLLSPLVVPLAIKQLFGSSVHLNHWGIMKDLMIIVVVPTMIGIIINRRTGGRSKQWAAPTLVPFSKLAFAFIVAANAASIAPHIVTLKNDMLKIVPVILLFMILCYGLGYVVAFLFPALKLYRTFPYASGMRNISLGVVLALGYFTPAVAVPVVLAILLQQPLATLNSSLFRKFTERKQKADYYPAA